MHDIIPGILEKDFSEIEKKIELVKDFAKIIHIDIIDGKFAPNTTFLDPKPFEKYTFPSSGQALFFEVHLMVENPVNYLEPFAASGFKRFLGHIEKMSSQEEFVAKGELYGEVGLVLDADTPFDNLKVNLEDLDCVLVMGVRAGFSGQSFVPEVLEKVKKIKEKMPIPVEIDGGIDDLSIVKAFNAGVERFVTTSFLFEGNPFDNYQNLLSKIR
ncbi:MAG: hypothetical protein M1277_01175 [Patescibacteria group bacterium]|nr:hypothetical protein [Patescibacteria group bacterium]